MPFWLSTDDISSSVHGNCFIWTILFSLNKHAFSPQILFCQNNFSFMTCAILPTVNTLIRRRGHYNAWKLSTSSFPVRIEMLQLQAGVHYSADKIRKGCGRKLCHFGILSASDAEKCANHRSLRIDCRSVLGINPEGIKTVSGIFQVYVERLRNECGLTKFGFCVLSAP